MSIIAGDVVREHQTLVNVTEISEGIINPSPKRSNNSNGANEGYIDQYKLQCASREHDLARVTSLDITINCHDVSCGDFGNLLPNLRQLRLTNSYIPAIRELGTSFNQLDILWISHSSVRSLDGIVSFSNLCELYVAFNEIKDLTPCSMLDRLEVLDAEGNLITNPNNLSYLKTCKCLTHLTLQANPLIKKAGGIKSYRKLVRKMLPQVKLLDDMSVDTPILPRMSLDQDKLLFDEQWEYINDVLNEVGLFGGIQTSGPGKPPRNGVSRIPADMSTVAKPSALSGRSGQYIRPVSAQIGRRAYGLGQEVTSPIQRPTSSLSSLRSLSTTPNRLNSNRYTDCEEGPSDLTTGQVVCGRISSALRRRKSLAVSNSVSHSGTSTPTGEVSERCAPLDGDKTPVGLLDKDGPIEGTVTPTFDDRVTNEDGTDGLHLLEEEDLLQMECEAVLKELASWRLQNSTSRLFETKTTMNRKIHSKTQKAGTGDPNDEEAMLEEPDDSKVSIRSCSSNSYLSDANQVTDQFPYFTPSLDALKSNDNDMSGLLPNPGGRFHPSAEFGNDRSHQKSFASKHTNILPTGDDGPSLTRSTSGKSNLKARLGCSELLPGQTSVARLQTTSRSSLPKLPTALSAATNSPQIKSKLPASKGTDVAMRKLISDRPNAFRTPLAHDKKQSQIVRNNINSSNSYSRLSTKTTAKTLHPDPNLASSGSTQQQRKTVSRSSARPDVT